MSDAPRIARARDGTVPDGALPRLTDATLAARTGDGAAVPFAVPDYARAAHGPGIVHLGFGAFHRAHQALCTDTALAAAGGDWRIVGASLRSTAIADEVVAQDGLYTVLERDGAGTRPRVIGSVAGAIAASRHPDALIDRLADPATRIVSLTVTEKAYAAEGEGSVGDRLVDGLARRRAAGHAPYAVLCCDNLESNGEAVRRVVLERAEHRDAGLARWIEAEAAFPSTMVDRIVPASTGATLADARAALGLEDRLAVEAEPFFRWVLEDRFPTGRPAWEAGGATFVDDVGPWEAAKLAMLNGAHSLIAYAGTLAGHETVADAVGDPVLRTLVRRHMLAAAATLPPGGPEPDAYAGALLARFDNPELRHRTAQIAMDGSEKVPKRWLGAAGRAAEAGHDVRPFVFALATWVRWCAGRRDDGSAYGIDDPRVDELRAAAMATGDGRERVDGVIEALGWRDAPFVRRPRTRADIAAVLDALHAFGVRAHLEREARGVGEDRSVR